MSRKAPVIILLATHNGERFLPPQLDSILAQSHADWRLLIRDDASSDRTPKILEQYVARDSRIGILPATKRVGPTRNFGLLMEAAPEKALYFLSDQDDVWPADRLQTMISAFEERQSPEPADIPALLHTDLRLIDADGSEIAPSMHRALGFGHLDHDPLGRLITQNFVTGCSAMFNDSLRRLALPLPAGTISHDWWLGLLAASSGRIHYLPQSLIDYRRHSSNVSGIGRQTRWSHLLSIRAPDGPIARRLENRRIQSLALEQRIVERLPDSPVLSRLREWNQAWSRGGWTALRASAKYGIRLRAPLRTAFFRLQLLLCRRR